VGLPALEGVAAVRDWVTELAGVGITARAVPGTDEIQVNDPRCHDTKKHLYFNTVKLVGFCQKCGGSVSHVEFRRLMGLPQLGVFQEIAGLLETGLTMLTTRTRTARSNTNWFPPSAVPVAEIPDALAFLQARGWSEDIIRRAVPYATPRNELPYAGRVIIPVVQQEVIRFWVARDYTNTQKPKYLYPAGAPVSQTLYPWDQVMPRESVWLVEGLFDAWHLFPHALCLWSLTFSHAQRDLLLEAGVREVVFCWDADVWSARRTDLTVQAEKVVREAVKWFKVKVVKLKSGDPTDYNQDSLLAWGAQCPLVSFL
jgi:hypothetical protein